MRNVDWYSAEVRSWRSVKKSVANAIRVAKEKGRKICICGQAPSDYAEFTRFLVEQGLDSMSLNPDAVIKTTLSLLEMEKDLTTEAAGDKVHRIE